MNIVHVIPALTKGGAERVLLDLANHAAAGGHCVTVLAAVPVPTELLAHALRPDVQLRYTAPDLTTARSASVGLLAWMVRNRRWLFDQDVVHCHLSFGAFFGSMLQIMRRLFGAQKPVVVETNHTVGMAVSAVRRAAHARLLAGRDATAFMAEDEYWAGFVRRHPERLMVTIPNGIAPPPPLDPEASERYRKSIGLPRDALVVGTVGRLIHERRPDILLAAFVELKRRLSHDVHLLLAGEGPQRHALEEDVRRHGLQERVHMPGLIMRPIEALGLIDLYITVNVGEITGIAALEAAFSGLPIIAVQMLPDYEASEDDWIWSSAEPAAVAARAADLLADPTALASLAARQQAYARANHSVEAMARDYERLYQDALSRRAAGE